jgi:hypothetical protein
MSSDDMDAVVAGMSMPIGDYEARLYARNGYDIDAQTTFSVSHPSGTLSTFAVTDDDSTYAPSDLINVAWTNGGGGVFDWVGVRPDVSDQGTDTSWIWWDYVPTGMQWDGSLAITNQPVGEYLVEYLAMDSYNLVFPEASIEVTVEGAADWCTYTGTPTLDVDRYALLGDRFNVAWSEMPAIPLAWLAVMEDGAAEDASSLGWIYLPTSGGNAHASGSGSGMTSLFGAGNYDVRLYDCADEQMVSADMAILVADGDADSDGVTNADELGGGTDPLDAEDPGSSSGGGGDGGGSCDVADYTLESSDSDGDGLYYDGGLCPDWDNSSGNTLRVGASEAYTTITDAVDAAVDGDTIEITSGTYTEWINVGAMGLCISAADGANVV